MGVDLSLIVERSQGGQDFSVSRNYDIFQQLSSTDFRSYAKQVAFPVKMDAAVAKDFDGLPEDLKDGYGGTIHYITAEEASQVKVGVDAEDTVEMIENFKKMPPSTKIAMFWH